MTPEQKEIVDLKLDALLAHIEIARAYIRQGQQDLADQEIEVIRNMAYAIGISFISMLKAST